MRRVNVIYIVVLLLTAILPVSSQNWKESFQRYLSGKPDSVDYSSVPVLSQNDPYFLTLKGLWTRDASQAVDFYQKALEMATDQELRLFLVDKIADFYYAQGLYITAEKFLQQTENGKPAETATSSPSRPEEIFLQYGVFSTRENAERFVSAHGSSIAGLKILQKEEFFYVVSGPYFDEQEARDYARKVKKQFKLNPFIKKF